jgi:hypothetical protein
MRAIKSPPLTSVLFRANHLIDIPLARGNGGPGLGTRSLTGGVDGSAPPTNTVPGGPQGNPGCRAAAGRDT